MKTLSLKLDDDIYQDTESVLETINISRNRYINEALLYYNRIQKRNILAKALEAESKLVAEESTKVLAEFESLDDYDG
jgi:hypothetical protein